MKASTRDGIWFTLAVALFCVASCEPVVQEKEKCSAWARNSTNEAVLWMKACSCAAGDADGDGRPDCVPDERMPPVDDEDTL